MNPFNTCGGVQRPTLAMSGRLRNSGVGKSTGFCAKLDCKAPTQHRTHSFESSHIIKGVKECACGGADWCSRVCAGMYAISLGNHPEHPPQRPYTMRRTHRRACRQRMASPDGETDACSNSSTMKRRPVLSTWLPPGPSRWSCSSPVGTPPPAYV